MERNLVRQWSSDRIGLRLLLTWGFVSNIFTKKMLNVCVLSCNYPFVKPGWCYKTRIINYLNVTTSEHWLSQTFKILHTKNMTKLFFWRIEIEYRNISWYWPSQIWLAWKKPLTFEILSEYCQKYFYRL